MAPISMDLTFISSATSKLAKRTVSDPSVIGVIVIFALLATAVFITAIYVLRRVWMTVIGPKLASRRNKALEGQSPPPTERRESHWARKNSNVLWSMYINDDDLAKQFARPCRKDSRLFSVGSVSTLGPLDTIPGPGPAIEEKATGSDGAKDGADVRSRPAFEPETTPTKSLPPVPRRATHGSTQHKASHSFDAAERRKISLASAKTKSRQASVAAR